MLYIKINYLNTAPYCATGINVADERTGLSFTVAAGPRQRSHSRDPSPVGLANIFYCLRLETSLFVASYDSQSYGSGIRRRLHTRYWLSSKSKPELVYEWRITANQVI
jgi:hypothetical protein